MCELHYVEEGGYCLANQGALFQATALSKAFVNTQALKAVTLSIGEGEIRALVGENGSGKSTLVSIISGILKADSGKMYKNGKGYSPNSLLAANQQRVSIVVQEVGTIDGVSVAANLFLGKERQFGRGGFISIRAMAKEAEKVLSAYGIVHVDPLSAISELSFEDRKLIEFAKALLVDPEVLIVDETTTSLSNAGREILFSEIVRVKNNKKSVIFITHDISEVFEHCDTVSVLKDGEVVGTIKTADVDETLLKEMMVGRELTQNYYREDQTAVYEHEVLISVHQLRYRKELRNISFELHRGEILGLGGLTDCGMHSLGRLLFGIDKADGGDIVYSFANRKISSPFDAVRAGIGYLPKNRDQESVILLSTIKDNICLPSLYELGWHGVILPRSERRMSDEGTQKLNVKMSSVEQLCMYLSGGNKQKVALSKWLVRDTQVFILDCPTRGIDVAVKASIYSFMRELKRIGKSIIMISEELQELIGMCDRIIVLKNGEINGLFERGAGLSEEKLIHFMI